MEDTNSERRRMSLDNFDETVRDKLLDSGNSFSFSDRVEWNTENFESCFRGCNLTLQVDTLVMNSWAVFSETEMIWLGITIAEGPLTVVANIAIVVDWISWGTLTEMNLLHWGGIISFESENSGWKEEDFGKTIETGDAVVDFSEVIFSEVDFSEIETVDWLVECEKTKLEVVELNTTELEIGWEITEVVTELVVGKTEGETEMLDDKTETDGKGGSQVELVAEINSVVGSIQDNISLT